VGHGELWSAQILSYVVKKVCCFKKKICGIFLIFILVVLVESCMLSFYFAERDSMQMDGHKGSTRRKSYSC
jgi:hypothetical protein